VDDGSPLPAAPRFNYSENGIVKGGYLKLSPDSTPLMVDVGTQWTINVTPVLHGLLGERWDCNCSRNGNATANNNTIIEFIYNHQYLLTMKANPPNVEPNETYPEIGQTWEKARSSVPINATSSSKFEFVSWFGCNRDGCYSGSENPAKVTMNGPVNETAVFYASVVIESQNGTQFIIVDNETRSVNDTSPFEFDWNSTLTIVASDTASCGFSLGPFDGCVYHFKEWIITEPNGTTYEHNKTLQIDITGPTTIVGVWEQNYLNLVIAAVLLAGIVAGIVIIVLLSRRKKPPTRPIPTEKPRGLRYRVGLLSDVGKVRTNNEDAVIAVEMVGTFGSNSTSALFCAVADGVGGAKKGEVASALALQTVVAETSPNMTRSRAESGEILKTAIEAANEAVVNYGRDHRESEGLASTIVASIIDGKTVYIAHAGDSRAYLVNRDEIKQLTKDDSQVQELVDAGKITADEARHYPGRNIITRAVGGAADIQVSSTTVTLQPDDRILLCSDGLWEPLFDVEIQKITMQSTDPQLACDQLVSLANQRGGRDNASIIIVEMLGP
jgi:protein phosphatase